jgi:FHA domain
MPPCPDGHESAAADYCDVCGIRIDGSASAGGEVVGAGALSRASAQPSTPCPRCGALGLARFCEVCGYAAGSAVAPRPVPADAERGAASPLTEAAWTAVVTASRTYYETVLKGGGLASSDVPFPDDYPERRVPLTGSQMRIGRRSFSKEVTPEIDLTGPPADPAISRLHAVLLAQPDGSWTVVDPGSENGTTLNGSELAAGEHARLHIGDTLCIGAWTAITFVGP